MGRYDAAPLKSVGPEARGWGGARPCIVPVGGATMFGFRPPPHPPATALADWAGGLTGAWAFGGEVAHFALRMDGRGRIHRKGGAHRRCAAPIRDSNIWELAFGGDGSPTGCPMSPVSRDVPTGVVLHTSPPAMRHRGRFGGARLGLALPAAFHTGDLGGIAPPPAESVWPMHAGAPYPSAPAVRPKTADTTCKGPLTQLPRDRGPNRMGCHRRKQRPTTSYVANLNG